MNPFIYKDYQKYNLDGHSEDKLIWISNDLVHESIEVIINKISELRCFKVQHISITVLQKKAIKKLVIMPTTYLAEKCFSTLVNIKIKTRNKFKKIDELMRGLHQSTP